MSSANLALHVKHFNDVREFMQGKIALQLPNEFTFLSSELLKFRAAFFVEEAKELQDATLIGDLGTAADSLIDLVYIITGAALLQGVKPEELANASYEMSRIDNVVVPINKFRFITQFILRPYEAGGPCLLLQHARIIVATYCEIQIKNFVDANELKNKDRVLAALAFLYNTTMTAGRLMRVDQPLWHLLWDDVHRANMCKERVLRPGSNDADRGGIYDVVKPANWDEVKPRTQEIIEQELLFKANQPMFAPATA